MTQQQQRSKLVVGTQADLARFCNVHRSTIHTWAEQGMPGGKAGPYSLKAVLAWLFSFGPWRSENARDEYLRTLIVGWQEQAKGDSKRGKRDQD